MVEDGLKDRPGLSASLSWVHTVTTLHFPCVATGALWQQLRPTKYRAGLICRTASRSRVGTFSPSFPYCIPVQGTCTFEVSKDSVVLKRAWMPQIVLVEFCGLCRNIENHRISIQRKELSGPEAYHNINQMSTLRDRPGERGNKRKKSSWLKFWFNCAQQLCMLQNDAWMLGFF